MILFFSERLARLKYNIVNVSVESLQIKLNNVKISTGNQSLCY